MTKRYRSVAITTLMLAVSGCSTVRPPSGFDVPEVSYVYQAGRASRGFPTSPRLETEIREALADVGVHSVTSVRDPDGPRLEGRTADGRRASAKLFPRGSTTIVSARIGLMGDEPLSRAFLDRVGARLVSKAEGSASDALRDDQVDTASDEESRQPKRFSKNAVSDEVMLRGMEDRGYRGSLEP